MTKGELVKFLEPFDDEIRIVVRKGNDSEYGPYNYELKYIGMTDECPSLVAIYKYGAIAVYTGVSA